MLGDLGEGEGNLQESNTAHVHGSMRDAPTALHSTCIQLSINLTGNMMNP